MLILLCYAAVPKGPKSLLFYSTSNNPSDDVGQLLGSLFWSKMSIRMVQIRAKLVFLNDFACDDERLARATSPFLGCLRLLFIRHREIPTFPRIERHPQTYYAAGASHASESGHAVTQPPPRKSLDC